MSVFDNLREKIKLSFSEWIQVVDDKSNWTMDNVEIIKDIGVNPDQVKPHCVKCVVANQCWFKNEKGKKPENFDYIGIVLQKLKGIDGLYHPHCHCKEIEIPKPTKSTINVFIDDGKIDDFFSRKNGLAQSWGYKPTDKKIFKQNLLSLVINSYLRGKYKIFKYDGFGIQISIYISMPGINEKEGRFYNRETGFMLYPNGKIQNDTAIARKWK